MILCDPRGYHSFFVVVTNLFLRRVRACLTFIFLINVPQVVEVSEKTKDCALMLFNWEEFSSNSPSDPAFDVYEVISWIALSN